MPWLDIQSAISVGRVDVLPLNDAVKAVRPLGRRLRQLTSDLRDQSGRRVNPAIALLSGKPRIARARITPPGPYIKPIERLFFAATLRNCGCQGKITSNSNATTFQFFYQNLGGQPGFVGHATARRWGVILQGSTVGALKTIRPPYCGKFSALDKVQNAILAALVRTKDEYLDKALHFFYRASTDSGDLESDTVLLDTAFEALLGAPSKYNTKGAVLLKRFNNDLRLFHRKNLWSGLLGAIAMLREQRNKIVHPHNRRPIKKQLPRRKNVPTAAIYERCFIALVLAYLVDTNLLALDESISEIVVGTEVWLRDANDDYCRLLLYSVKYKYARRLLVRAVKQNWPRRRLRK